jgi:hypothetical protein
MLETPGRNLVVPTHMRIEPISVRRWVVLILRWQRSGVEIEEDGKWGREEAYADERGN